MKNKVISDFLKKYWTKYLGGIAFLILSAYIQTLAPAILGKIIDLLDKSTINSRAVLTYTGYMILAALGTFVTRFIWRYFIMGNARNMECYLRQRLFEHFQSLPVEFYNTRKTGDLVAYAVNDISAVRQTFGPGVALIINGVGLGTISVISMVGSVNLKLTVLSLLPIPIIVFMMLKIGGEIQKRFRKVQENFAAISDRAQENISGIRVIKSYVQEDMEVERFEKLNDDMKASNVKMVRVSSLTSPLTQALFGVSFMINLIYGSSLVKQGVITLGDFVAFNGYLTMIMRPVISIGRVINIFQRGMASYKRLNEIFEVQPAEKDLNKILTTDRLGGSLEIKNLTFNYPNAEEPALKNINLKLNRGQVLGIMGKTGSGKTTLINVLLRLYDIEKGKVFFDGKDINDVTVDVLRESIGCVPQDNFLFSATIDNNIRFFSDEYSDEDVENAAKMSLIYQSVMDFPEKFETLVGERGVNLSGGQKQRISIARAIIKNPSILILDDSLSAVDTKTEESILENLKEILQERTGIIIANRVSAVKNADQIVIMDSGRIVERGTHDELMEKKGIYFDLYQEQIERGKRVEHIGC